MDDDSPVFVISVAAELSGMHPPTGRRYSTREVALLREVQRLSQEEGVNLAGIKRVIELENQVEALQARLAELADELELARRAEARAHEHAVASLRRDLVPVPKSALVVWKPTR